MKINTLRRLGLFLILYFSIQFIQAQCCDYTLYMLDGYGDGWNGGKLEVFINNQSIGEFYAKGFGSFDKFTVCNGDDIRLNYSSGDYEEENSYQLLNEALNVVFHDEFGPNTGTAFEGKGSCGGQAIIGSHPCEAAPIDTVNCINSDNFGLIGSFIFPNCSLYNGHDKWYVTQAPKSGNLVVETSNGSLNDIGLAVYEADACSNLRILACTADNDATASLHVINLRKNATVYIQVFGYDGATGTFELCVRDPGGVTLTESELPIVVINAQGNDIPMDSKIDATMDIKYRGPGLTTQMTDPSNIYSGKIGIEIRGASSAGYPQPPYGLETRDENGNNNNVSILDMPEENDWVFLSHFNDRSLVRNALAFKLFEDMGNYSVRARHCEVVKDSVYQGIYLMTEKIKRDKNRINIADLTNEDVEGDDLTGGYILQQNYWNNENSFQSNYSPIDHPGFDIHFLYEYPEPGNILNIQKNYIASYVDSLETALYSNEFADIESGYRKYLDVKSFIDYFLVNELARNADGFKKSVFFHKDKNSNGGKLKAGPVWDFDWAWKNIWGCYIYETYDGSGWAHLNNNCPTDNYSCGWYVRLLQDESFANELRCTYESYRNTVLGTNYIFAYMDSIESLVIGAQQRHFKKWPILGISGPAPELGPIAQTYQAEMDTLKQWIKTRINWLDNNIPGLCEVSNTADGGQYQPLTITPNPAWDKIEIHLPSNEYEGQITIYNATGQPVHQETTFRGAAKCYINVFNLPSGMYWVVYQSGKLLNYKKLHITKP